MRSSLATLDSSSVSRSSKVLTVAEKLCAMLAALSLTAELRLLSSICCSSMTAVAALARAPTRAARAAAARRTSRRRTGRTAPRRASSPAFLHCEAGSPPTAAALRPLT
eukprot:CAMPEP_0118876058 /NCGR_PEP_ID=MMETSP1163-20130328/16904_1 /TAXON_ID=124430 /ORGANISM="Phaeomonas parva, Strain CCMP2877" /LENGTH=108 /DNA_ID=CAMNT_0006811633 /DNA_START=279 /DNA_END=606 /DNA_ORIENTATION=-